MRRRLLIFFALLVIGGIGVLMSFRLGEAETRVVSFPDGSVAKVLGAVRSGSSFSSDRPWQSVLRRTLPARWQGVLPPLSTLTCGSGNTNHLVVFFELTAAAPWSWLVAVDEAGFRYPISGGSCSSTSGARTIHGVTLFGFPRRQKTFWLEFLDQEQKLIARARVPNPLPVPPAESAWQPQSLPTTQTNGELVLTLASIRERTNRWGSFLNPEWQTQSLDPRWQNARMGYLRVFDPVGNEGGFLSRGERVWQLDVTFHRGEWESFDATERMVVTNLAVPNAGEMIQLDRVQDCAGAQVTVEGLYGRGTLYITNGLQRTMTVDAGTRWGTTSSGNTVVESFGGEQPFFVVEAAGLGDRDEFRFRLTDEQGREVKLGNRGGYQYRNRARTRVYQLSLEATNEVRSLSLEVVVSRAKEFVFYISPQDIQPPP